METIERGMAIFFPLFFFVTLSPGRDEWREGMG